MSQLRTSRVLCFAAVLCLGALCPAQSVVSLGAHNIQPAATAVAGPGGKASRKGRIPDDVVTHSARAQAQAAAASGGIQTVFVIGMENQNFVQPTGLTTTPEQILGNPAAPYLNSLVKPGNPNAAQVSFASNYQSTQVHPSEPNYIWSQAGSNLGVYSDSDPYSLTGTPQNEQTTTQSLCNFLQQAGVSWKSYQEDINIDTGSNQALAPGQWTVPLFTVSGAFTTGVNRYNGSNLYSYGPRHNPPVIFTSTSGGFNTTTSNPEAQHYPPLQQLLADLTNNTVARYNWITPDLYNDMHTALPGGYTYHGTSYTGDQAEVAQGDNFLSQIVPLIMASQAYTNHGMIVLWWDETEGGDSPSYTMPLIVISPNAKGNAYTNNILYNHSSDLLTIEEIFGVGQCPGFACLADDLSDLLVPGSVPEPPPTVYGYSIGKIIPEFTSFDQFGIARSIRDYQGQYVLLDMSAGWCVPSVYMARFSAGVGKTLTDAGVPFEYVSVLLEGNGNQGGGGEGSGYSNRFDAEEWAFEAHEDSPVLYNPYQPGVPSTYGLWNAIDAFSFGELPSLPTVVLLGPDQKILYEEIGAIDGQVLLNDLTPYLTRYSVKPGLVSPPPVPGPFDSVNLQVAVNGERFSADIPLAGASDASGCCSSESWVALGGLHLWASGSQNVYNSIVTPFGLVNAFGTGIDIVTDRGVCMFAGGSKCPSITCRRGPLRSS